MRSSLITFFSLLFFSSSCFSQDNCFVITETVGKLYRLNPGHCHAQLIGVSGINFLDIAITPSGNLYGIGFYDLYKIDTATASATYITDLAPPFTEILNNLVALNDSLLLVLSSNFQLLKVNVRDGSRTVLGTLVNSPAGDITYYKGNYYMAGFPNKLVKITLDDELTTILSETVIGPMHTSTNNVYGIITTGEVCESMSKMYGFEEDKLYEINPEDATVTLICSALFPGDARGAASMSEALAPHINQPLLPVPNIFTPNNDGINDLWQYDPQHVLDPVLEIYNRWGQQVHSSYAGMTWDGNTFDGSSCGPGIYYFVLRYEAYCGEMHVEKGCIQLLR